VIHKTGTIMRYFPQKKFGWIQDKDGSSIFFHSDNFWDGSPDEIEPGQDVIYTPALSRKDSKSFALNIRIVSPELIEAIGTDTRLYGYVTLPAEDKGFGYISPTYSKAQLFFHRNSVMSGDNLETGRLVSFRVTEDFKGLAAIEVAPVSEAEQLAEGSTELSATA
jgi:cold shock CspA family protein